MNINGARAGAFSGLQKLVARAMSRDLHAFAIPGPELARVHGLNIGSAGLRLAATPRHAGVLLVIGPLPQKMRDAAAVVYAQMPRPRVILALGSGDLAPLPPADVSAELTPKGLNRGVAELRQIIASGAFAGDTSDFTATVLEIRIEYTCPMHPEVVSDDPGDCPKCGMTLMPRETSASAAHAGHDTGVMAMAMSAQVKHDQPHGNDEAHQMADETPAQFTCPMHPEVVSDAPGSCPKCGMFLVPVEDKDEADHSGHHHHHHDHDKHASAKVAQYTCPMHPEVVSDTPGSCPKCGMHLVPIADKGEADHSGNHHHDHDKHASAKVAQYTCPMHPEVINDAPGSCPKCGMNLVPVEDKGEADHSGHHHHDHGKHASADAKVAQYTCPMHPEVVSDAPGDCPKCGMFLVPVEDKGEADHSGNHHHGHDKHASAEATQYTCPMHPEVVSDDPGSCPKCGMFLVPVADGKTDNHDGHGGESAHSGHGGSASVDGIEPQFMSMIELTKDQPRSSDGLQMDWIPVAFGPFFPGLPGGLDLELMLDGDTVAGSKTGSVVAMQPTLVTAPQAAPEFIARLAKSMPLTPVSYQLLAILAIEDAVGVRPDDTTARTRAGALERERIASHLNWLSALGAQAGFGWLANRAAQFQSQIQDGNADQIASTAPALLSFIRRIRSTPLLRARLKNIGRIGSDTPVTGPVARAQNSGIDLRGNDATYAALGFVSALHEGSDALARFLVRCTEIDHSLQLIAAAGNIAPPVLAEIGTASGTGSSAIETPRGAARLEVQLDEGQVVAASLETPSALHAGLIEELTAQQELGDALVAVASLDISPWEMGGEMGGEMVS